LEFLLQHFFPTTITSLFCFLGFRNFFSNNQKNLVQKIVTTHRISKLFFHSWWENLVSSKTKTNCFLQKKQSTSLLVRYTNDVWQTVLTAQEATRHVTETKAKVPGHLTPHFVEHYLTPFQWNWIDTRVGHDRVNSAVDMKSP
jgi:ABC-type multidrug transport system fused ATPase/permease subunit